MKKRDVILNTEAHRPAFNDLVDLVHAASHREGWRSYDVLRHWLDASFRALRGPCLKLTDQTAFDANEAEYMKLVERCRHPKETMADLGKMLGCAEIALRAEPIDFIGPVFSQLAADAGMGQFFTPWHLSYMMAKMIIGERKAELIDKPYLSLMEPASGVGGMCLATNAVLREQGFDISRQAHWMAIDIDFKAMCGCYIQLELTDASANVYCGNTLSRDPPHIATATSAAYVYPKRLQVESAPPLDQPPPAQATPADQLSLF